MTEDAGQNAGTAQSESDTDHMERLTDTDHPTKFLGEIEGMAVSDTEEGPMLFLHGDERSAAVLVSDDAYTDGLARAGVEIEELLSVAQPRSGDTEADRDV